jgi:hypothetical protein
VEDIYLPKRRFLENFDMKKYDGSNQKMLKANIE